MIPWVSSRRKKDYPSLAPNGQTVETIAVPAVLAVFNWGKRSDRYRRIERFAERLFTNWDKFLVAPRHPKWRDVNLAAARYRAGHDTSSPNRCLSVFTARRDQLKKILGAISRSF